MNPPAPQTRALFKVGRPTLNVRCVTLGFPWTVYNRICSLSILLAGAEFTKARDRDKTRIVNGIFGMSRISWTMDARSAFGYAGCGSGVGSRLSFGPIQPAPVARSDGDVEARQAARSSHSRGRRRLERRSNEGNTGGLGGTGLANQCVILVGGLGTRLGERTKTSPKLLLDVGGAPFLEILFAEARRRGFDDFLLLAGHRSEAVAAFLAERDVEKRFGCRVVLSIEPTPLGAGGALVHALPRLRDDFLLLNGDTWFDFNWLDLVASARHAGAEAALSLREIAEPARYETFELEGSLVREIRSRGESLAPAWVNGGVYYLTRRAVEGAMSPCSLERDIMPTLVSRGALRAYPYSGFFVDIGVPETLAAADELVAKRRRRPAVFLDRDGVLNIDRGYVHAPEQIKWVKGAKQAVKLLNDAGYYLFVVTNQAGVAKGHYPEEKIGALHRWMAGELAATGASIDDWRYCPFHPEGSVAAFRAEHDWRKPSPGMLLDLFEHWPIEREGSFLIGDKPSDIQAADAAGVPGYLFEGDDLTEFVRTRTLLRPLGGGQPVRQARDGTQ
jgi:D,D-heptose 1,7-bisphosphate phosphatase